MKNPRYLNAIRTFAANLLLTSRPPALAPARYPVSTEEYFLAGESKPYIALNPSLLTANE